MVVYFRQFSTPEIENQFYPPSAKSLGDICLPYLPYIYFRIWQTHMSPFSEKKQKIF